MQPAAEPTYRRVLVIAYYFPPMGLSGVQRVAKFVKYLPSFGWQPVVLTAEPAGYFAYDASLLNEVKAAGVEVHRTPTADPTRLFGRGTTVALPAESSRRWLSAISQSVFVPDNKIGWTPFAYRAGRRLLRDRPFDAILASAPPYSAQLLAARLSRASGLPLVLDFRDDWVGNPRHVYPTPLHRAWHQRLERRALRQADAVITINRYIEQSLAARNQGALPGLITRVIPQGFDAADFDAADLAALDADGSAGEAAAPAKGRCRWVYAGVFYDAQTPDFFLKALAQFVQQHPACREDVEACFVGLLPDASRRLIRTLGLEDVVSYTGYLPHSEAVEALQNADVLWMTVGRQEGAAGISTSKVFEYMGTRKPILALVPDGDVSQTLAAYGAAAIVDPEDVDGIAAQLHTWWLSWKGGTLPAGDAAYVARFERKRLTGQLAALLDAVIA